MKEFSNNNNFDLTQTVTYHLSIMLSETGYSFCIVDLVRQSCVTIKNVNFDKTGDPEIFYNNVNDMLKGDALLNKNYKSIDFIFTTPKSTLVPLELFDKKKLRSYFEFNQKLEEFEEIHFNRLNRTEAINIFCIPSEITTLMVNQFPELNFYHQASKFIDNSLQKSSSVGKMISVMVHDDFFDIMVASKDKLILYNSYWFQNENDFVYHIVNTYQQLELNQKYIPLYLSGNIDKNSTQEKLLSRYISKINFIRITDNAYYKYKFKDVPEHYLTNLLNIE